MKITQAYEILNNVFAETMGESAITVVETDNLVDIGKQVFDNLDVDSYVKSLINHIGRVVFVNRTYDGSAPSLLMDGWEFGSILQKIDADIPESEKNESWDLVNGREYKQDIFKAPTVVQKFFNSKVTYEIAMSFTDIQVKQSFSNAQQLAGFFSMIEQKIRTRLTIDFDNLSRLTLNNFIAATVRDAYGASALEGTSHIRARNLLYEYNQMIVPTQTALTPSNCLTDLGFLKYASKEISLCSDRMRTASTMFNMGDRVRYTPRDLQKIVMLSDFAKSADVYLQSGVFHNELTKLPEAETVPFWQGSGTTYDFVDTSKVNVQIKDPSNTANTVEVEVGGVLCTIFDRDAAAVCNVRNVVTSHYVARAEFTNNWYKAEAQYINDYNENFVVFFVA